MQNGTLSIKIHCPCLSLCASSSSTCKCAFQDRIIPCISCPHGVKGSDLVFAHIVCFGRADFSLWILSSKEQTKYITKQESLPEHFILLWFSVRVFQWFHRHSTRPRKNLPCLTCPKVQYCNCKTNCKRSHHSL